jgi:hypothetical protein
MSDTPETDDLARGNHVVPTEWAQQLERERNEAREKFDTEATEHMLAINKVCGERDEARIQYRSTLALAEALANTQIKLKKERDEAHEVAEMLYNYLARPAYDVNQAIHKMEVMERYKKMKEDK